MSSVVIVDKKYRIAIPIKARKLINIKPEDKLILRVKANGTIELIPLETLLQKVHKTAEKKLQNWVEEEHEATKLIENLVKKHEETR